MTLNQKIVTAVLAAAVVALSVVAVVLFIETTPDSGRKDVSNVDTGNARSPRNGTARLKEACGILKRDEQGDAAEKRLQDLSRGTSIEDSVQDLYALPTETTDMAVFGEAMTLFGEIDAECADAGVDLPDVVME